jgi:undecaprenyl pyrophosphate phosphatase UppP
MPDSTEETRSSGGLARRIVTIAWAVISSIQFVIWLLMSLISTSFKSPFWLWTIGIGGVALLLWWYLDPARRAREGSE